MKNSSKIKFIKNIAQYAFGFSYLGGRGMYNFLKKVVDGAHKNIHSFLPFLSQVELLKWSKDLVGSIDGLYDKAMDAEYLKTHIGGGNHRLFDGGHDPINSWEKVANASSTDSFSQEVIGYVSALWKEMITTKGLPFFTADKSNYDKSAEWVSGTIPGANKNWFYDLHSFDVFEILSTSLGFIGVIFYLKKDDQKKLSEILGSMGIISIIAANPLMGLAVIATTAYAYKNKKIKTENAIKGAGQAGISLAIFNLLGLPILIELFIVINVLRMVKGEKAIGADFIYNIFSKIKLSKPSTDIGPLKYQLSNRR